MGNVIGKPLDVFALLSERFGAVPKGRSNVGGGMRGKKKKDLKRMSVRERLFFIIRLD